MSWEYVYLEGIGLEVYFEFSPEEQEVRYYNDGSGYPGCAASLEISEVLLKDVDIINLLSEKQLEEIEKLIREKD